MAKVSIEIPDAQIDAASKAEIKLLKDKVRKLETKIANLERSNNELKQQSRDYEAARSIAIDLAELFDVRYIDDL